MKQCLKCSRILPLRSFAKMALMVDGRSNVCKECSDVMEPVSR